MVNRWTLVEMAEAVRARRVSPSELLEAHLRQIENLNPRLNAFVTVLEQEARQAARAAEEAVMRGEAGPLAGVPVTVKDSFDMAGLPTRCGSRFRQDHRAARDATAVARLRRAGAVILGKTNTPEFLMNYETDNHITGRTNSPWDLERTPGGSSGGEAAAIASFCSAGGIGSDGGGSVRIPAHFSGIAALKPTPGRVSAAGHFPDICHPGGLLGVAGPMARTARDLRLLFEVLAGYDPEDPFSAPVPLRPARLDGLCVGVMEQFYDVPVQAEMREAVREAARALGGLGVVAEEFTPRGLERAPNLWWFFFGRLNAPLIRQMIGDREDEAHWTGIEFLKKAEAEPTPSTLEVLENLAARDKMRSALLRQLEEIPVLLLPPCGVTAFRHRERRWATPSKEIGLFEAMMPVTPWNLLSLPAVVIPWKLSGDGLPVGIQLVGRPWEEETLLELAVTLEEARGPLPAPPLSGR
ncbi:MAG: amidase [Bryobacterales bacterium]|nr:amidase [Bryobacteraceae bacterium]MDW8354617.1 amidase [Bryobacterales bacterium]